jgi:hypothetical protein
MGLPLMSSFFFGIKAGPPSFGSPSPLKTLPRISGETASSSDFIFFHLKDLTVPNGTVAEFDIDYVAVLGFIDHFDQHQWP